MVGNSKNSENPQAEEVVGRTVTRDSKTSVSAHSFDDPPPVIETIDPSHGPATALRSHTRRKKH
jgi:hypothetical protein